MNWLDSVLDDYFRFLKDKTIVTESEGTDWVEISTPFTGLFNDTLDVFAKREGNQILLSDDGVTLKNLELSGLSVTRSPKRKVLFDRILANHGISHENEELIARTDVAHFAQSKLDMITAMSEVNDLHYLAKHTVASVFLEDVREYLDDQDIIYTPQFISRGISGLEFTFDFQVAYRAKEIVIQAFSALTLNNLPQFLFKWDDVKAIREKQTGKALTGLAVINDEEHEVKHEYLEALNNKGAHYILWSKRHEPEQTKKLAA